MHHALGRRRRSRRSYVIMTTFEQVLSPGELRVFEELVNTGDGNIAIAERLELSDKTIKNHIAHIFHKTKCDTRLELAVRFYKERERSLMRRLRRR